jgi:hypothetical protein
MYRLNPNYVIIMKQNIDKLLVVLYNLMWRDYMAIPNCSSTKEKWETRNLCGFQKIECSNKKNPFPLPFINEVLNIVVGCEAYSFLDGYFWYNHISINPKYKYKTIFGTDWGTFIWRVMPFGIKNGPPTF